ncbi:MAG: glutathione peroxidase [Bacteriovoracaceae bacterium]|jgi:glutathione peroxidase|nr:glutathione peroxidase [Bacteriovoracaceae bacterium]
MNIYDFNVKNIKGEDVSISKYKGKKLLIVNTASKCGFTPQYEGLEVLYKEYKDNLEVLAFPCNQFGAQEPSSSSDIEKFCSLNFNTTFPIFEKVEVNGKKAHPLYEYLKEQAPGLLGSKKIKWNFTKFLVDENGNVLKRYAPTVKPKDIAKDL